MQFSLRSCAIAIAALLAVAAPAAQALSGFGLSAAEFSRPGEATLRVAGFAFSIWGPLYLGMLAFTAFQFRKSARAAPWLAVLGWPAAMAFLGCGLWIAAAALNARYATLLIIALSAAVLILGLLRAPRPISAVEFMWIALPLSLLAGWLTIATAANALSVLTMERFIPPHAATPAALLGLGVMALTACAVTFAARNAVYPLPVVWGLVGVYVGEAARQPLVGFVALAAAAALLAAAAIVAWRARTQAD